MVSATRWEAATHALIPGLTAIEGRRFLALYEIECEDVQAMRDQINRTSSDRTHSETLELDPLPITLIFRTSRRMEGLNPADGALIAQSLAPPQCV